MWFLACDMYSPFRKRIGLGELFVAGTAGVFIQLYVWSPKIKEQIEKEKLEKEKQLKQSTETDPKA